MRAELHGLQNGGGGEGGVSLFCDGEKGGYGKSGDGFEEGLEESGDASLPDSRLIALRAFWSSVGVTIGLPP